MCGHPAAAVELRSNVARPRSGVPRQLSWEWDSPPPIVVVPHRLPRSWDLEGGSDPNPVIHIPRPARTWYARRTVIVLRRILTRGRSRSPMAHVDDPSDAALHGELPCTRSQPPPPNSPTASSRSATSLAQRCWPSCRTPSPKNGYVARSSAGPSPRTVGNPFCASPPHRVHLKTSSPSPPCSLPRTEAERRPRRRSPNGV